tara:strand:- start:585 stop:770 length:186 start_codon:yes stop_codon:yes gene_type:complete
MFNLSLKNVQINNSRNIELEIKGAEANKNTPILKKFLSFNLYLSSICIGFILQKFQFNAKN